MLLLGRGLRGQVVQFRRSDSLKRRDVIRALPFDEPAASMCCAPRTRCGTRRLTRDKEASIRSLLNELVLGSGSAFRTDAEGLDASILAEGWDVSIARSW